MEGLGWDQFVNRPGQDTPYILFYHRLGREDFVDRMPTWDKLAMVIADNRMSDREFEEQQRVEEEQRRVEEEQRRVEEEQRRDKEEMAGQNNPLKRFFEERVLFGLAPQFS